MKPTIYKNRERKRFVNTAGNAQFLDALGIAGASCAFSLRKLRGAYNGPAIYVRRDSDNQQTGIGFLPNGDFDIYSLMGWVGAENLILWSVDFTQSSVWTAVSSNIIKNAIRSPNGISYAQKMVGLSLAENSLKQAYNYTAGQQVTGSIFVKKGEFNSIGIAVSSSLTTSPGNAVFDLTKITAGFSGSVQNATIKDIGDGWFRCTWTFTPTVSGVNSGGFWITFPTTTNDGVSGIYLWGAQLNNGAVALDFCATGGAATASGSGFVSYWFDQSGNGRDLTQATLANQPRIVNAGVIDRFPNGKPGIYTDGVSDWMTVNFTSPVKMPFVRSCVIKPIGVGSVLPTRRILTSPEDTTLYIQNGTGNLNSFTNGRVNETLKVNVPANPVSIFEGFDSGSPYGSYNGNWMTGDNTFAVANLNGVSMGGDNRGAFSEVIFGDIIVMPFHKNDNSRRALELNQKTYWGL